MVGLVGFKPTIFPPQTERDNQITLQADKMAPLTTSTSQPLRWQRSALTFELQRQKMVGAIGIEPMMFTTRVLIYSQVQHEPTATSLPNPGFFIASGTANDV